LRYNLTVKLVFSVIGVPQDQHLSNVENIVALHFLHSIHTLAPLLGTTLSPTSLSSNMSGRRSKMD
jgi:hypothetical protein